MLVYYCATNFAQLSVINGNERGGSLGSIADLPQSIIHGLKKYEVFLDNLTGDYYIYDHPHKEWKPTGNVGLHYSKAMATIGSG